MMMYLISAISVISVYVLLQLVKRACLDYVARQRKLDYI